MSRPNKKIEITIVILLAAVAACGSKQTRPQGVGTSPSYPAQGVGTSPS